MLDTLLSVGSEEYNTVLGMEQIFHSDAAPRGFIVYLLLFFSTDPLRLFLNVLCSVAWPS